LKARFNKEDAMSALTRFEPRDDFWMEPFRDPFPDMFRPDFFRRMMRMPEWSSLRMQEMKLDVVENDKEYQIKAEIPGAKKEDVQVRLDGNYVSISAEVKDEKKETKKGNGDRVLLHEMHHGTWSRGFTLPHEVDESGANAKFENGVLMLTLPKRAPASGKTIAVQ
jgi:HSP20 family protein